MGTVPSTTITADELEALGYAVDLFELRAEDCAERETKGSQAEGTAALIHFYKGVADTLAGLRARCVVES